MNPMQSQLLTIIFIFGIFYLLVFRPQKRAQDEHKKMIGALKKNDEVVTSGGIHGVIVNVKDATVMLKVDDNVKIEVQKNSISSVKRKASE